MLVKLNKKLWKSLIKAGAFEAIEENRAELLANSDSWMRTIAKEAEREDATGYDLFGSFAAEKPTQPLTQSAVVNKKPMQKSKQTFEFCPTLFNNYKKMIPVPRKY